MVLEITALFVVGVLLCVGAFLSLRFKDRIADWFLNESVPQWWQDDLMRMCARFQPFILAIFGAFLGTWCVAASLGHAIDWIRNGL